MQGGCGSRRRRARARRAKSVDARVSIYELSGAVMSGVKIHRRESVCARVRACHTEPSYNSPTRFGAALLVRSLRPDNPSCVAAHSLFSSDALTVARGCGEAVRSGAAPLIRPRPTVFRREPWGNEKEDYALMARLG